MLSNTLLEQFSVDILLNVLNTVWESEQKQQKSTWANFASILGLALYFSIHRPLFKKQVCVLFSKSVIISSINSHY